MIEQSRRPSEQHAVVNTQPANLESARNVDRQTDRLVTGSPGVNNSVQPTSGVASSTINMPASDSEAKQKAAEAAKQNPITIHIGYLSILVLLVIVVAMILLLYFFYNVMSRRRFFHSF